MSDPALGLSMLTLIVIVIMMGFPDRVHADGARHVLRLHRASTTRRIPGSDNRVFDLMVERTYGAMTNDVLISIPLFVLMGYVMERGALVDKMFYSIQLAFRRVPASLAVATLIVCTFWGIASGLVGAVVVLMGVIAFNPMLKAGYDVKLASGVITAGGTLGILIPPSVMIIVYAAVAGQSVVKLYAAAMFPGFFLSFLYLVYIVGWAIINPKIAPRLPEEQTKVPVPAWLSKFAGHLSFAMPILVSLVERGCFRRRGQGRSTPGGRPVSYWMLSLDRSRLRAGAVHARRRLAGDRLVVRRSFTSKPPSNVEVTGVQQLGTPELVNERGHARRTGADRSNSHLWFWGSRPFARCMQVRYYWRFNAERLRVVKLLTSSTMPLGILTSSCSPLSCSESHGDRVGRRRRRSARSCWRCRPARSTGTAPSRRCS